MGGGVGGFVCVVNRNGTMGPRLAIIVWKCPMLKNVYKSNGICLKRSNNKENKKGNNLRSSVFWCPKVGWGLCTTGFGMVIPWKNSKSPTPHQQYLCLEPPMHNIFILYNNNYSKSNICDGSVHSTEWLLTYDVDKIQPQLANKLQNQREVVSAENCPRPVIRAFLLYENQSCTQIQNTSSISKIKGRLLVRRIALVQMSTPNVFVTK